MSSYRGLIPGILVCLKQAPEYSLRDILRDIRTGRLLLLRKYTSFCLLRVHQDAHFNEKVLLVFLAYSPPSFPGFLESVREEIVELASAHQCTKILAESYVDGYQQLIAAGKACPGVQITPYHWKYVLTLNDV